MTLPEASVQSAEGGACPEWALNKYMQEEDELVPTAIQEDFCIFSNSFQLINKNAASLSP